MNDSNIDSRNSHRSSKRRNLLIWFTLAWFALSPTAPAVSPAPDGAYPNNNTAEGEEALLSLTNGSNNTAIGFQALQANTSGNENTATGADALVSNTTGEHNTATGWDALEANTSGHENTATGFQALLSTTGSQNTATGSQALLSNTADNNTATGFKALYSNTNGTFNTATGVQALLSNTTGFSNTAIGVDALLSNQTGSNNTASGTQALFFNINGIWNTASGAGALLNNTSGNDNTADGVQALGKTTTGSNNVASGVNALFTNQIGHDNTAEGFQALQHNTGSSNIAVGSNAGASLTSGSNNIDIGAPGVAGEANTIRLGKSGTQTKTFIAGISGKTAANSVPVFINSNGQLGTVQSSARFKDDIKPMDKASKAILALKPVTFRYKQDLDPDGIPQFGLIAEQVEKVNRDLVVRDEEGKVMTVRYDAVNAMLLNEFLKEHRKVEEQAAQLAEQQKQITGLTAGLKEQAAQIQKVSAQFEADKKSSRLVANKQ